MAKAIKAIDVFQKEIDKYARRIKMIKYFEEDRKALYEIDVVRRYTSSVIDTVLAKVVGYLTESVQVKFLAGEGQTAHDLNHKKWRFQCRSIKFEAIQSWKKVTLEDLPTYIGCKETSEELSKLITRK